MAAPDERIGRPRAQVLAPLLRVVVVAGAVVALLPFVAIARGLALAVQSGEISNPGVALSFVALLLGSAFFLYSVRYYLATLAILLSSLLLTNGNGNSNGNSKGHEARVRRRGGGKDNGNGNGNGNGGGHLHLDHEPFVSIHIATYNEKRVIGRLLQACAALDYGNYEVVFVDDSTDETAEILEQWRGRKPFNIVHREGREGFKGGALAVALQRMDPRAEYVIVWDADVIPFPDSIQTFLPHFFKSNGNGNG